MFGKNGSILIKLVSKQALGPFTIWYTTHYPKMSPLQLLKKFSFIVQTTLLNSSKLEPNLYFWPTW